MQIRWAGLAPLKRGIGSAPSLSLMRQQCRAIGEPSPVLSERLVGRKVAASDNLSDVTLSAPIRRPLRSSQSNFKTARGAYMSAGRLLTVVRELRDSSKHSGEIKCY